MSRYARVCKLNGDGRAPLLFSKCAIADHWEFNVEEARRTADAISQTFEAVRFASHALGSSCLQHLRGALGGKNARRKEQHANKMMLARRLTEANCYEPGRAHSRGVGVDFSKDSSAFDPQYSDPGQTRSQMCEEASVYRNAEEEYRQMQRCTALTPWTRIAIFRVPARWIALFLESLHNARTSVGRTVSILQRRLLCWITSQVQRQCGRSHFQCDNAMENAKELFR